jgi:hypothetical protein
MPKIEMKINRYVKHIGKEDVILDNGIIIQVPTQTGNWGVWNYCALQMSKKLFKQLKDCEFIYIDKALTDKANERYEKPFLTYYRFDIDRLIKNGYPIVEEGE